MGNGESVVRNVDKRSSRREHRAPFAEAVGRFRARPFAAPAPAAAAGGEGGLADDRAVRVCVRKRPIFPHEASQGEFDVVTCLPGRVVVHDARMHPDMKNMFINHHDFAFDEAFGEAVGNDEVYARTAKDLVRAALAGRQGTVMMYGQTGSGKTYTMSAVYDRAAVELFEGIGGRQLTVSFVELSGDKCFDMLNGGSPCTLTTAADGSVHPYPSVEVAIEDASELLALIGLAAKLRATAATGVHDQSSRSHAVCRIFADAPAGAGEGSLTLVDLAGSEHRIDNAEHNAERQKEGAKINASLAALKECIRAASRGAKFVAFRQNRLTQILRGCFSRAERHQTVVIATVSPSSKDTEHSMNTLRHACIMDGQGEQRSAHGAHVTGGVVTKETLGEIDVTGLARERRAQRRAEAERPPDEWRKPPAAPAHQAKQSNTVARAALDRRAVQALPHRVQRALVEARTEFGSLRQRARLSHVRAIPEEEELAKAAASDPASSASSSTPTAASAEAPAAAEIARALELFRAFVAEGRHARDWRKNDLRLINSCVVPMLFGEEARINWSHPNFGLDQLEGLVRDVPAEAIRKVLPPKGVSAGVDDRGAVLSPDAAAAPPIAPQSGGPGGQSAGAALPGARPPPAPGSKSLAASGRGRRHSAGRDSRGACDFDSGAPRSQSSTPSHAASRAASPASGDAPALPRRVSTGLSLDSGCSSAVGGGPPPASHRDAVRARREALEKSRLQSLQKALENREPTGAGRGLEAETAELEAQIASGQCSAAAAVGLKKRLAALRAQALREQRRKEAAAACPRLQQQPQPRPPAEQPRESPEELGAAAGEPLRPAPGAGGGEAPAALGYPRLPEPVVPPPRCGRGQAADEPPPWCQDPLQLGVAGTCADELRGRWPHGPALAGRPGRVVTGAAAAPWGNALSEEGG